MFSHRTQTLSFLVALTSLSASAAVLGPFTDARITAAQGCPVSTPVSNPNASVAAVDFNGDRYADIVAHQYTNGNNVALYLHGEDPAQTFGNNDGLPSRSLDWSPVAIADFNRDGKPDIVWRNTQTGANEIWLMNGFTVTSTVALPAQGTYWVLAGAADFNGDRQPDLIWRQSVTGQILIWYMTSPGTVGSQATSDNMFDQQSDSKWKIAAVADYDFNGKPDLYWHNTVTGESTVVLDSGTKITLPTILDTGWSIVSVDDYRGDGSRGILWENFSSGLLEVWNMSADSSGKINSCFTHPSLLSHTNGNNWNALTPIPLDPKTLATANETNILGQENAYLFGTGYNELDGSNLTLRALHGSYVLTYPAWDTRLSYAYRNVHQWLIQERRKNEAQLLVQSAMNGAGACVDPVNGRAAICFSPGVVSLDRTDTALGSAGGVVTAQVTLASDTPGATFTVSGNGCAPGTYPAPQTLVWVAHSACSVTVNAPNGQPFSTWTDGPTKNPRTFDGPESDSTYTASFGGSSGKCSYVLSSTSAGFPASAGSGSVNVAAPEGCTWTAMSNASWLTVTAGASGTASATVSFNLDANNGTSSRSGSLTIGGQTMTVTQAGTAVTPPTALRFVPVTPCRIADTRNANDPFGGPVLRAETTRDFAIPQSACGIPANAQAYSLNFTVVPAGALGYITVFPTGQAQPLASTLNSFDGRTKANAAIVPAGINGAISVFATNDTQLVLDIDGYFVPALTASALGFYPLTPCRLVDTRGAAGLLGGPFLAAQQERVFPVLTSSCQVPATAQAYSLDYTVIPKGPLSFLTTWPTGRTRPLVSTLNAPTGTVTANAAIVPAGDNGDISVFVTDDTDLVIDINGYFGPPTSGALSMYNLAPCRVYDSRTQPGGQPVMNTTAINVAGNTCGAPANAQSYIFNATVVPSSTLGFLALWPNGAPQPVVSTLNADDGAVTSNMALVPTTNGSVNAFLSNPTQLILDIFGYFAP